MNTLDMTALKVFACGVVAVAVTLVGSYGFIASTAVVRTVVPAALVASATGSHLAQSAATGLLE
jgi:hypothetical protein